MVKFVTIKPFHKSIETIVRDLTIQTIVKYLTTINIVTDLTIYTSGRINSP